MTIDNALEVLKDYRYDIVAIYCDECGIEFYFVDDTARFCPNCGSANIKPKYDRDVELLDFGLRRGQMG